MSDFDLSALSEFREGDTTGGGSRKRKPEESKGPEPVADGFEGVILAVDQSIANSGWAVIDHGIVTFTGNIKTDPISKGHEDTLQRAMQCYRAYDSLVTELLPRLHLVVHEMPPVGSRMMRPESSLVSATALRIVADAHNLQVVMVGAQKAKKRFTGNGNAKKAELGVALKRLIPTLSEKSPMNQAIYDAIGVGLVAYEQERRGR